MEFEIALIAAAMSMAVSLTALFSSASRLFTQKRIQDVVLRAVEESVSKNKDVNHAIRHSHLAVHEPGSALDEDELEAVKLAIETAIKEMDKRDKDLVTEKLQSMNELSFSRYLTALSYKVSGNRSALGLLFRRIFKGSILTGHHR